MKRPFRILEDSVSIVALMLMALLPVLEMALRSLGLSGVPGSTMWVQHLVFLVAFLGAAIAAREGELLSLSTGSFFRGTTKRSIQVFTAAVGLGVCIVLTWGSAVLVIVEREGGRLLTFNLPVWVFQLVMPVGFSLIGVRILLGVSGWKKRLLASALGGIPLLATLVIDLRDSGVLLPLLLILVAATALGAPIFVGLGGIAAVLLWNNFEPLAAISSEAYNLTVKPILPTIPLFTLAGYILAEGGTPQRLVAVFRSLFGWIPGGVAIVGVLVCAFFTSFTGGSGVTILAMGGLLYPMLRKESHSHRFTTGLLTSAGSLGLLFPPSLAVILFSVVAEIDVRRLFVSGLVPAILELALVSIYILTVSRRRKVVRTPFDFGQTKRAVFDAKWELAIPVVVLGAVLGGFATLVQTSAVTVLYAFLLEFVIRRNLKLRADLLRVVGKAATLIGGVLLILGVAMGLTNFLIFARIPDLAVGWVQAFVESPLFFLLLFNLLLLIVGCIMDIYSAIVVVVPLVVPVGLAFGIDPFHLGIIFLVNLELGYLTPPVGMNLFLASYRFERPLVEVYRSALPFLAIRAAAVLLVTYIPFLSSFLPNLVLSE